MAVFSPTNAKVHFKAYDGSFTDSLSNTGITQQLDVTMSSAQKLFGQQSMYMEDFGDSIVFTTPSVFDVGTGDYTVGFWFHPTQFTSYDRLFVTDGVSTYAPLRIYCHNGTIQVYVDDAEDEGVIATDSIANYYLGADGEDQWWHIMVRRDSGTTKTYINGIERGSSTMSYSIDYSSSSTLGADWSSGSGTKGYIQDFFWTEEAVSFTQADFTPGTAEPITFHNGNPSISSFSTSAASVANSGDSVTLSWSVSGETKLELLKYVGGILSSTEDVLGLSSKLVTITETVSYKLRATNDNSAVDSASVQIQLSQGGNNMSLPTSPVVIQGSHLSDKSVMDALVVSKDGNGVASTLSVELQGLVASDASLSSAISAEASTARAAESANAAAISAEAVTARAAEGVNAAGLAQEILDRAADVDAEEARALAAEAGLSADITAEASTARAAESANAAAISAEAVTARAAEGVNAAGLAQEILDRAADVDAEEVRALAAEAVLTADVATNLVKIGNEEARALAAEAAEEARALAAEAANASDIVAEATRAGLAEVALGDRLDDCKSGQDAEAFTTLKFSANGSYYTLTVNASGKLEFV